MFYVLQQKKRRMVQLFPLFWEVYGKEYLEGTSIVLLETDRTVCFWNLERLGTKIYIEITQVEKSFNTI